MKNVIQFVNCYYEEDENFFIVAIDNSTGKISNYYHNKVTFDNYFDQIMTLNESFDRSLYFSINSFKNSMDCEMNEFEQPRKTKSNVSNIKSIVFDFDEPETSVQNCTNLIKTLNMTPSYILETSPKKFQICYRLNDSEIDFKEYELVNKTLAKKFNSDINVCSIEKVFRLPNTINHKNGFKSTIKMINMDKSYSFSAFKEKLNEYITSDEILNKYYLILKDKGSKNKVKNSKATIKSENDFKRSTKKPKSKNSIELDEDSYLDESLIYKYERILKNNKNDASVSDILYIKERAKSNDNYDEVFNEIVQIRDILDMPIKRDLSSYYDDRAQFMY
jgi:hypothetical protein